MNKLSSLPSTPVDLAPWGYLWRRDRVRQACPEADFIPHRLRRIDTCYRTAKADLGVDRLKPWCYVQQDIMADFPPPPAHPLLTALLWVGGLTDYTVELVWPDSLPDPATVEVRAYPTAWGWFGWTIDHVMPLSAVEGNRYLYHHDDTLTIDYAYNSRVKAQTEMIAVFAPEGTPVPTVRLVGDSLGCWESLTFTVEWGLDPSLPDYQAHEAHVAIPSEPSFDPSGKRATFTCLYSPVSRYGTDSRFTVITDRQRHLGATVLLRELAEQPILVPEAGLFFTPASRPMTAKEYLAEQERSGKKSLRRRVAEHEEVTDWQTLLRRVRLWRCPDGTAVTPFPQAPAPAVLFDLPDKRWQTMYELAVEQLRGPHMWGHLASEVFRVSAAMEMVGLKEEANRIYDYFLASPGVAPDGDYTDGDGSLEWAKQMVHGMCYAHEGSHFSTGGILYSMMLRYLLHGDGDYIRAHLPRIKQAADWIIRMRRDYMKDEMADRQSLHVKGLMPPAFLGDYALPCSDWRWYYNDNASQFQGLNALSLVLRGLGDPDADHYAAETASFAADITAAAEREALYAPVRRGSDGLSRSFLPRMAYCGGLLLYGGEGNVPQFDRGINDLFQGALPLSEIGGPLDPLDRRMVGTLDAMEESGTAISLAELKKLEHPTAGPTHEKQDLTEDTSVVERKEEDPSEHWFWNSFSNLPKISHNANIYLRQDDIPNFLRYLFNHAVMMVGTNGKFWEHAHPTVYTECMDPDNGTSGWFAECFRDMLATEDNGVLWLAKGTPRAWLRQGKEISVAELPTFYGKLTYTVSSDVDNRRITAEIALPQRKALSELRLRLRHPKGARISSAEVKGGTASVAPDGETVVITGFGSDTKLSVTALY